MKGVNFRAVAYALHTFLYEDAYVQPILIIGNSVIYKMIFSLIFSNKLI